MENKQNNTTVDTSLTNEDFLFMRDKLSAKVKEEVDDLESAIGSIHYSMKRLQNQLEEKTLKLNERKNEFNRIMGMSLDSLLAPVAKETEKTEPAT